MKSFQELKIPESLRSAITAMGFELPTPIQAQAIPMALEGKDVVGQAQTGSGKTAAFLIPLITRLMANRDNTALVLVPTRELASQVDDVLKKLIKNMPDLRSAVLIGGVAMKPQLRALSMRPRILIATPGRLIDHLGSRSVSLVKTTVLVLDEADRMLDMGFAPQLLRILTYLPRARQTMLFSATMPSDIEALAKKFLNEPTRITVAGTPQTTPDIKQATRNVPNEKKNAALFEELKVRAGSVLIFTRTKHRADRVAMVLTKAGMPAERIHGNRSQAQREKALLAFKTGRTPILVATDIAARGIDIDHVAHVINYDLPKAAEDYVHRIGRTGRAGRAGEAVSFLTSEDQKTWKAITRLLDAKRPTTR